MRKLRTCLYREQEEQIEKRSRHSLNHHLFWNIGQGKCVQMTALRCFARERKEERQEYLLAPVSTELLVFNNPVQNQVVLL